MQVEDASYRLMPDMAAEVALINKVARKKKRRSAVACTKTLAAIAIVEVALDALAMQGCQARLRSPLGLQGNAARCYS